MDQPAYQIKQLIFATQAVSQARAQAYEAQLKTDLTSILIVIEQALRAFDQTADIYCIARLEINLGQLSRLPAYSEWIRLFTQALQQALTKVRREERYTRIATEPNIHLWRLFDYFIRHGTWPWWSHTSQPLSSLWEKLWPSYASKLTQLFCISVQQEYGLQRFIYHLSGPQLTLLLQAVQQKTTFNLADFYQALSALSHHLSATRRLPETALREAYWRLCVQHLTASAPFKPEHVLADYLNYLAMTLQQPYPSLLAQYLQAASLSTTSTANAAVRALHQLSMKELPVSIITSLSLLIQELRQLLGLLSTSAQPAVYRAQLRQLNQQCEFLQQQGSTPEWNKPLQNLQHTTEHLLGCLQQSVNSAQPDQAIAIAIDNTWLATKSCQEKLTPHADANISLTQQEACEGYLISYAGVILLHPFLPFLFKHCRLLKKQSLAQPRALQKALLLIHFLATGDTITTEEELTLGKLFCGLPVDVPLVLTEKLSPHHKEQARALLGVVKERWTLLKNSTDDGLRQAFLQRPGILKREAGLWCLRLEKQGCDALLDKLPWALTPVKSPWMQEHLVVAWR
jgi:hypothetical protein